MHKALTLFAAVSLSMTFFAGAQVWPEDGPEARCQILDNPAKPIYRAGLSMIPESRFEGYGDSSATEIDIDWYFAELMDIGYGDVDLNAVFKLTIWGGSAGVQMPDQLLQLALDTGWTWRYENGMGFQVRAMPGVYSDMEKISSDMFYLPFSFAIIHAFDASLSGILGAQIRPSFNRVVMPLVGVEWQVNDEWRLQIRVPESRVTWYAGPGWNMHAGFDWNDTTYSLREKGDFNRGELTVEDTRLYVGTTYRLSDQIELTGDIGSIFARSVTFEDDAHSFDGEIDVGSDLFLRFGIIGPF